MKIASKRHLEGSGAPFGKGLGRVWEGFGRFGDLLNRFLTSFFHACIWDGLQKSSWRLLDSILARF